MPRIVPGALKTHPRHESLLPAADGGGLDRDVGGADL